MWRAAHPTRRLANARRDIGHTFSADSAAEIESLSDESADSFECLVRMIGVRGVATACQHQRFGWTVDLRQNGIDLPDGPVLVVLALHDQYGTRDGW